MTRGSISLVVIAAAAAFAVRAEAQPAAAMGRPLPDASLKDGTVVARLIAGDRSKPVAGSEVTITVQRQDGSGTPMQQTARTDSEGRCTFSDIPPSQLVKLTAPGLDGDTVASSQFPMPTTGGVRVMISTVKMTGADMGAGPMAGGPPMSPRQMSGQGRPEEADSNDTLTVRLSYDDFTDPTPPRDQPVILVGYRYDQHTEAQVVKTDGGGRATFRNLDRRGSTSYFAMTLLPHGTSFDRLTSTATLMPGDSGLRMMLSADKRTSPAVDDLDTFERQPTGGVPPNHVNVTLVGVVEPEMKIELVDLTTGKAVATAKPEEPDPEPDSVKSIWGKGSDNAALAVGALQVAITVDGKPVPGAVLTAKRAPGPTPPAPTTPAPTPSPSPAPSTPAPAPSPSPAPPTPAPAPSPSPAPAAATPTPAPVELPPQSATSDASGLATLTNLPAGVPLELSVALGDLSLPTHVVTLPTTGGRHEDVDVSWKFLGQGSVHFSDLNAGGPDHAYAVRVSNVKRLPDQDFLSAPFQLTPDRGAAVTVMVLPRLMMSFDLTSWIDDDTLDVSGRWTVQNVSWAPYLAFTDDHPDELVIPLPKHFVDAEVRPDFADVIGVDKQRGYVIRRPLPPGAIEFPAGFRIQSHEGDLTWDMSLPFGLFQAGMEVRRINEEMSMDTGDANFKPEEATAKGNKYFVLSPIDIQPRQRMVFHLHGLPQAPGWKPMSARVVGILVVIVLGISLMFALRRPARAAAPSARFDQLLDELAALDAAGGDAGRRAQLMAELEALAPQVLDPGQARGATPGQAPAGTPPQER